MTLVMAHDVCTLLDDSIVDDHRSPVGVALALHVGFGFGGDPCRLTRAGLRMPSQCCEREGLSKFLFDI